MDRSLLRYSLCAPAGLRMLFVCVCHTTTIECDRKIGKPKKKNKQTIISITRVRNAQPSVGHARAGGDAAGSWHHRHTRVGGSGLALWIHAHPAGRMVSRTGCQQRRNSRIV